jgi:hypothetical protein
MAIHNGIHVSLQKNCQIVPTPAPAESGDARLRILKSRAFRLLQDQRGLREINFDSTTT